MAGRPPPSGRSRGRVRRGLVSGPRWRRPHPARRRRGPVRPAARCARHRLPERLASTLRPRGPHRPRTVGEPRGPGRSRGARRARVAGNIDQAARRIHGGRVQDPPPLTARPRRRRRTPPVTSGPAAPRGPESCPPGEREEHQRNQAKRETCHAQSHAHTGDMAAGAPAQPVGGGARHHENPARHDHHGADHRQGNDKPHPPGWGGIRAHRSTIASWFAARKPYRQVRLSRLASGIGHREAFGGSGRRRGHASDTLWP